MDEMLLRIYYLVSAILIVLVFATIPLAVYSVLCFVRDRKDKRKAARNQHSLDVVGNTQDRLTGVMAECPRCSAHL